jgi:hypothetical protein
MQTDTTHNFNEYQEPQSLQKSPNKLILIVITILLFMALGLGLFFFLNSDVGSNLLNQPRIAQLTGRPLIMGSTDYYQVLLHNPSNDPNQLQGPIEIRYLEEEFVADSFVIEEYIYGSNPQLLEEASDRLHLLISTPIENSTFSLNTITAISLERGGRLTEDFCIWGNLFRYRYYTIFMNCDNFDALPWANKGGLASSVIAMDLRDGSSQYIARSSELTNYLNIRVEHNGLLVTTKRSVGSISEWQNYVREVSGDLNIDKYHETVILNLNELLK